MDGDRRYYEFSDFRLDVVARELLGPDRARVPLTSKALDVLIYLIEQRGRVVFKNELLAAVWSGRIVEENNLTQAISLVRRAFGTGVGDHSYIVTIPGRGYRFVARVGEEGSAVATGESLQPREPKTLAVLPFRFLSAVPHDELFELGLAETLITRLSHSRELRVSALASSQRLGRDVRDPIAAGRQLGAAYVVDGSAQRFADNVRVNVRLLSMAEGATMYADTFDVGADDVFTLQDRIAAAVLGALALQPIVVARHGCSPCDGDDPAAYRAWLRGHHLLQRPNEANLREALSAFRRTIDLDTACTRAYASMALAYRGLVHLDNEPDEMFGLAKAAVAQALRIDPDSAEALAMQGRNRQLYDWDWTGAEASLKRAIELNPSLMEARLGCAHLLVTLGRFEEGLEQAHAARALDPLSPWCNSILAGLLTAARQPEAAAKQVERALDLQPDFWIALHVRGGLALERGDTQAALDDFQRATASSQRASQMLAFLATACAQAGDRVQVQAILDELEARRARGYVSATSIAAVAVALDDTGRALDELERAEREHDIRMVFLKVDARWNPLRALPRFRALAQRMGLVGERGYSRL
ncbi:MAG: winged helix-turn-helix domain-containing protein [Proteobacteria bacterium]|nr:winged helix-turn-helix domain-containing protein [Pseudomonadota bacterium]